MRFQSRMNSLPIGCLELSKALTVFCSCLENLHEAELKSNEIILTHHYNASVACIVLVTPDHYYVGLQLSRMNGMKGNTNCLLERKGAVESLQLLPRRAQKKRLQLLRKQVPDFYSPALY